MRKLLILNMLCLMLLCVTSAKAMPPAGTPGAGKGNNPGFSGSNNPGNGAANPGKGNKKKKTARRKVNFPNSPKIYRPKLEQETVIRTYESEKVNVEFYNVINNTDSVTDNTVGFRVIIKLGENQTERKLREKTKRIKELEEEIRNLKDRK